MTKFQMQFSRPEVVVNRRSFLSFAAAALATTAIPSAASATHTLAPYFWPRNDGPDVQHTQWNELLGKYIVKGPAGTTLVRYSEMRADHGALKAYLKVLQDARPSGMGRAASAAYWINLFNALTVDIVLEHYPVNSIRDIDLGGGRMFDTGPWSAPLVMVEGKHLSLDNIEHDILRPTLGDPGVLYSLCCAAISSPSLQASAFTSGNLGRYFRKGAREYINSPRGLNVDGSRLIASKIYDWYVNDFGGTSSLPYHWLEYASGHKSQALKSARLAGFDFDWSLNDAG